MLCFIFSPLAVCESPVHHHKFVKKNTFYQFKTSIKCDEDNASSCVITDLASTGNLLDNMYCMRKGICIMLQEVCKGGCR
jgi:hypothetical protein